MSMTCIACGFESVPCADHNRFFLYRAGALCFACNQYVTVAREPAINHRLLLIGLLVSGIIARSGSDFKDGTVELCADLADKIIKKYDK